MLSNIDFYFCGDRQHKCVRMLAIRNGVVIKHVTYKIPYLTMLKKEFYKEYIVFFNDQVTFNIPYYTLVTKDRAKVINDTLLYIGLEKNIYSNIVLPAYATPLYKDSRHDPRNNRTFINTWGEYKEIVKTSKKLHYANNKNR